MLKMIRPRLSSKDLKAFVMLMMLEQQEGSNKWDKQLGRTNLCSESLEDAINSMSIN